jgi:hypothetical protein
MRKTQNVKREVSCVTGVTVTPVFETQWRYASGHCGISANLGHDPAGLAQRDDNAREDWIRHSASNWL